MNHSQFQDICLSIKYDIDRNEFSSLCTLMNYPSDYQDIVWKYYIEKPLDFVLYHELGPHILDYLSAKSQIVKQVCQP